MKHISLRFLSLVFSLFFALTTFAVDASYYTSYINNKSGSELFTGVHNVAKVGYSSLTYNGLWSAYCAIDLNSSGKVWDMYSNTTSYTCGGSAQGANYSKEGDSYNREHSIPKSWFGGSEDKNTPGTDLFHVVPTDGYVNNMRSSFAFGEVASATYTSNSGCKKGTPSSITIENSILNTTGSSTQSVKSASTVFEPMNEYKGDFARGYFGTMLRWANGDYQTFSTAPGDEIFNTAYTAEKYYGLTAYGVALLLKWHREDPVSQKEIDRNNGIQNQQGNRNPFIDYPILAEYIWGKYTGETFSLDNAVGSFDTENFALHPDGDKNGTTPSSTKYTITWSKDGVESTTEVSENSRPTPPEAADCDANRVFMGWTAGSTYSGDGSDLMTVQSNFPQATEATTYYAVYADKETSGGGSSDASVTFSELGYSNQAEVTSAIAVGSIASVTFATGTGSNSPKYYTSGTAIRAYGGNTCVVSSTAGNISQIVITFGGSDGSNAITSDVGTYADGTWTGSASSVTFSIGGTSGNRRFAGIAVTVGGGSTTYSNYSTECTTCEKVTITFHENGGTGSMTAQQVCPSTNVALKANTFTREHYTFAGWSLTANGAKAYDNQETVNITANLDLYALWEPETQYTATFMNNGASYATRTGYAGETFAEAVTNPEPCKAGYTFAGWITTTITDSTATNPSAATVTTYPAANTTYYAVYKWDVEGAGGGESNDFALFSGTLTEGDYIIYYDGKAMDTTVTADRLQYVEVTPSDNKITTTNAAIIWHIAASGDYWTIYNADDAKYAASTGAKNKAQMLASGTDDKALWTASGTSTYEFVNKQNTTNSVNANLRNNGTYGFACYANTTGGALSLYKREGGSGTTTYYATSPNCEEQCTLTITVQSPDDAKGTVGFDE